MDYIFDTDIPRPCRWFLGRKQELEQLNTLLVDHSTITYYCCITTYVEDAPIEYLGINQAALEQVVDMDALENRRDCEVNGLEAVIGESDGKTYLCWTISPTYSCVLEYTAESVSDTDILHMAESVGEPER